MGSAEFFESSIFTRPEGNVPLEPPRARGRDRNSRVMSLPSKLNAVAAVFVGVSIVAPALALGDTRSSVLDRTAADRARPIVAVGAVKVRSRRAPVAFNATAVDDARVVIPSRRILAFAATAVSRRATPRPPSASEND